MRDLASFTPYMLRTAANRSAFKAAQEEQDDNERKGTQMPCICQYDCWMYMFVCQYKNADKGNQFSWYVWGFEKIQCDIYSRDTGGWETPGNNTWDDADSKGVGIELHFGKSCGYCNKKPCNQEDKTDISAGDDQLIPYKNLPEVMKKLFVAGDDQDISDFEFEDVLTAFLDYMDSGDFWPGKKDPAKKSCKEAGAEAFCKKGGGDPPRK